MILPELKIKESTQTSPLINLTEDKEVKQPRNYVYGKRTEIPTCQFMVQNYYPSHGEDRCGAPSIAYWVWEGSGDPFYVCEEHDIVVQESEGGEASEQAE